MPLSDKDKKTIALVAAGAAVLYFGLLNPVLKALGIKDSGNTTALNSVASNPYSFWSPNFYKLQSGAVILTRASAESIAQKIRDSFGWLSDNADSVKAAFKSLTYQTQVSYLSDVFSQLYGEDLLSYIRGGSWPNDRLSDADVSEIDSFLSKLPVK